MKFKLPYMEEQYESRPKKLKEICDFFCYLSIKNRVVPVVTRVTDHVEGESGVHPDGRAVDFRNEYFDGKGSKRWLYPIEAVEEIVSAINTRYPRNDGKMTCKHHSFNNGPYHFHIQIRYEDLTQEEKENVAMVK